MDHLRTIPNLTKIQENFCHGPQRANHLQKAALNEIPIYLESIY